jgi:hypothetical protein
VAPTRPGYGALNRLLALTGTWRKNAQDRSGSRFTPHSAAMRSALVAARKRRADPHRQDDLDPRCDSAAPPLLAAHIVPYLEPAACPTWVRPSADACRCPPLAVAIVTQLATRSLGAAVVVRDPALTDQPAQAKRMPGRICVDLVVVLGPGGPVFCWLQHLRAQ